MPAALVDPCRRAALLAVAAFASGRHAWAGERPPAVAPIPELATVYRGQVDPACCLVSEKYDGVRAIWDGGVLRHRSGRTVAAPREFVAALPREPLDGELWLGRGRFEPLSALVRRTEPRAGEWSAVRYMVFDQPLASGSFEARLARLATVLPRGDTAVELAPQWRVADQIALQDALASVVAGGGEGLVLHVASAPHASGRSGALLKLKPELDAEARVVGHRHGTGKYAAEVGAIEVESEGRRFFIGSGLSDTDRRDPPPLGSHITYRFRDRTSSGLPRFATYLRRHEDW
jgi:DNA ligase-1